MMSDNLRKYPTSSSGTSSRSRLYEGEIAGTALSSGVVTAWGRSMIRGTDVIIASGYS